MLARYFAASLLFAAAPAFAGADPKCGPHEHLVTEKDPEEGGIMKRCMCDEGWDAGGPAPPCRSGKDAAKDGKKKGKK